MKIVKTWDPFNESQKVPDTTSSRVLSTNREVRESMTCMNLGHPG